MIQFFHSSFEHTQSPDKLFAIWRQVTRGERTVSVKSHHGDVYTRVYPKVSGLSRQRNTRLPLVLLVEKQHKLIRLTHKIAIQLHLVAESYTICSSRSRRTVRKFLDTPSYISMVKVKKT
jgi:hypothetical protein